VSGSVDVIKVKDVRMADLRCSAGSTDQGLSSAQDPRDMFRLSERFRLGAEVLFDIGPQKNDEGRGKDQQTKTTYRSR
jgi:hypothetical protein